MVNEKPVNITSQIIMMFVPFLWIWAFYRINKLWKGLGLYALGALIGFAVIIVFGVAEGMYEVATYGDLLSEEISEKTENLALVISFVIATGIGIYFVRQWSIEWNTRISNA
jgi:hypothetical protein